MDLGQLLIVHTGPVACKRVASPLLKTGEFRAKMACNPFNAAAEIFTDDFDCLLLHVDTPGLDAINAISRIRSSEKTARIPIIVIVRELDRALEHSLKSVGANELVTEPISFPELIDKIRRLISLDGELEQTTDSNQLTTTPEGAAQAANDADDQTTSKLAPIQPEDTNDELDQPDASMVSRPIISSQPVLHQPPEVDDPPSEQAAPKRSTSALSEQIWAAVKRGDPIPGIPSEVSRMDVVIGDIAGGGLSKDIVALDLNLSIGILRQVNSIEFRATDTISGLARAIQRVGSREVSQRFLNSWKIRKQIPKTTRDFMLSHFCRHSLMVACLAEEIASFVRERDTDAIFSAGLLHDVGKLFLVHHFPEQYQVVLDDHCIIWTEDGEFYDVTATERELIQVDHGVIGYELCQNWSMPPIAQVGTIHHVENASDQSRINNPRASLIVATADLLDRIMTNNHLCYRAQEHREEKDKLEEIAEGSYQMEHYIDDIDRFFRSPDREIPKRIPQFIRAKRVPIRYVYERARLRLMRAMRSVNLAA